MSYDDNDDSVEIVYLEPKPFTRSFVLNETIKHIHRSVDISISKTIARQKDFENDLDKSHEILTTLSNLSDIKVIVEKYRLDNPELFERE